MAQPWSQAITMQHRASSAMATIMMVGWLMFHATPAIPIFHILLAGPGLAMLHTANIFKQIITTSVHANPVMAKTIALSKLIIHAEHAIQMRLALKHATHVMASLPQQMSLAMPYRQRA